MPNTLTWKSLKEIRQNYRQTKIHGYSDVDAFIYAFTNHLSAISQSESTPGSFKGQSPIGVTSSETFQSNCGN